MRIFGTPNEKLIRNKADFMAALRADDQKGLHGFGNDEEMDNLRGLMGLSTAIPGVETHRFAGHSSYLIAGTKKVWATARALDIKAGVVLSTEMKLIKREEKFASASTVTADPELVRLLQNPNPHMTISEVLYLWVWHICLTGVAFWIKDQPNRKGQPKYVYPVNPRFMRIIPDKEKRIATFRYTVNGNSIDFDPEEVIYFRRPHANDELWGLGEMEQAEPLYNEFINRSLYNERMAENGGFPTSFLAKEEFDGDDEQWEEIRNKIVARYGGQRNVGKIGLISGKWNVLQLGMTADVMQEIEKSEANVKQIFLNHGVPLSVVGFGSANYATARQEEMNFRKYAVLPLLNLLCDVLNSDRGFIKAFNPNLKLDFSLAGIIDVEQVGKDYGWLFDRGGVTSNDLRELAGLPRIKNNPMLDQYFVTSTYVPVEVAGISIPSEEDINALPGDNSSSTGDGGDKPAGEVNQGSEADQPGKDKKPGKHARLRDAA